MSTENKITVMSVMQKILIKLRSISEYSSGKALLAKIRNSIGKPINEAFEIWPLLFENLPEEFLGREESASKEELAILTAIQLFALNAQGSMNSFEKTDEDTVSKNFGYFMRQIKDPEDSTSLDRRFNAMITSTTFDELSNHLRHMVKIFKSKAPNIFIDYVTLADDLYWYLSGKEERVRLSWAREYYKFSNKGDNNNE